MSQLYVRVMTGFYCHRKTAKLKRTLGTDAYWIPPRLWAYAAEHQPDGNMSEYSSEELAEVLGCYTHATSMLQALKDCGFIEENGNIHDWVEHNGYHQKFSERAKKAADARWSKEKSPTPPKEDKGNRKWESGDKHCLSDAPSINGECEIVWTAYPRKVGKQPALKAISKAIAAVGFEPLMASVLKYQKARSGQDEQFTPHAATWFNQARYDEDPATWEVKTAKKTNGVLPDYSKGF